MGKCVNLVIIDGGTYRVDGVQLYTVVNFVYHSINYAVTTEMKFIPKDELVRGVKQREIILLNGKILKGTNEIQWSTELDNAEKLIKLVAYKVRKLMEYRYGVGTDLCGECIEASELIAAILRYLGYADCKVVEGWCAFGDGSSCSDAPYDPHTWVELDGGTVYIDVTADQFNHFMEFPYKPIEIRRGLPHGMVYNEPIEMLDN